MVLWPAAKPLHLYAHNYFIFGIMASGEAASSVGTFGQNYFIIFIFGIMSSGEAASSLGTGTKLFNFIYIWYLRQAAKPLHLWVQT